MDEARLAQILAERDQNPEAFRRDGHVYFLEALPLIQDMVALRKVEAKIESARAKEKAKEVPPKVVVTPKVSVAPSKHPPKRK